MQFLNEQENERANNFMLKVNEFIRLVAIQTISVAGQNYKPHDKRMIRIQGSGNEWMTKYFNVDWLKPSFDIKVANSSALPESKAQRTQNIIELNQGFPGLFSNEQVLEMLDIGNSDKLVDAATIAVRSAEAENNDVMNGEQMLPPAEYEDHINHWRVHARLFQSPGFKKQPIEVQNAAKDHMIATEMMMFEQAKKNPLFAKKTQELSLFPMFFFDETLMEPMELSGGGSEKPMEMPIPGLQSDLGTSEQDLENPTQEGQALVNVP
jgi:hypothetical protein